MTATFSPTTTRPVTYDAVISRTGLLLGIVVAFAAGGWVLYEQFPALIVIGAVVGFVLAMVNIFKKQPSPPLIMAYAAAEGVFLGGISGLLDAQYPGVALQAILATVITAGVTLMLYKSGVVRASARASRIVLIAMLAYLAFSLVNVGVMLFSSNDSAWGLRTSVEIFGIPLGIIVGVLAVLMAAYCLVTDFDDIEKKVRAGAPESEAWRGGFSLIVTLVWMYVEFLRIFAIARD